MEVFRRFAVNEKGIFTVESIEEEDEDKYSDVFLPFSITESQFNNLSMILFYASRITENFGKTIDNNGSWSASTVRKEFKNEKIIISTLRRNDWSCEAYFNEVEIRNSEGKVQFHADRSMKNHHYDTIRVFLDKTNGKYDQIWRKIFQLDSSLSHRANMPSFYELTKLDFSNLPEEFY